MPCCADETLDRIVARIEGLDDEAVAFLGLLPERIDLREEPAGIERGEGDWQLRLRDQMGQDLVFETEARGEDDAARGARGDAGEAIQSIRPAERLVQRRRPPRQRGSGRLIGARLVA